MTNKEQYSMPRCDIEELKLEIKKLKKLLLRSRHFLRYNAMLFTDADERKEKIIKKIDKALLEGDICEKPVEIKEIMGIKVETMLEIRRLAIESGFYTLEEFIKYLRLRKC